MSQDALTSELKERLWDLKRWCRHDRYDHDRTDHQMVADFHCATIDMVEMALRSLAPPSAIAPSEPNWRHCPHRECGENMRCNWSMLTCAAPRMEVVPSWQPIETAPQDGSEFVAAYGHQGFVKKLVNWNRIYARWESKGAVQLGFMENATHWMPLPDKHDKNSGGQS